MAEHPLTIVEELRPIQLRDSVVYEVHGGHRRQMGPARRRRGRHTALLSRPAEILPEVYIYCRPIIARPPVTLPVYTDLFWTKWFPRVRSRNSPRLSGAAPQSQALRQIRSDRGRAKSPAWYMEALKVQQLDPMERSLQY